MDEGYLDADGEVSETLKAVLSNEFAGYVESCRGFFAESPRATLRDILTFFEDGYRNHRFSHCSLDQAGDELHLESGIMAGDKAHITSPSFGHWVGARPPAGIDAVYVVSVVLSRLVTPDGHNPDDSGTFVSIETYFESDQKQKTMSLSRLSPDEIDNTLVDEFEKASGSFLLDHTPNWISVFADSAFG